MKNINTLNSKELKKVFENNSTLQNEVMDDMLDSASFWASEYLDCWDSGIDYNIGWDRGAFFKAKDNFDFIAGLEKAQQDYGFLCDEYNKTIKRATELAERLYEVEDNLSEKDYERLSSRVDELIETLESACFKRFMDEYRVCFDEKNQLDYFLEFYVDERMDSNNYYVDDDYILYQHCEYEKCYA